ncbi:phage tail assembly chaperone [Cytobacillus kochii]|uniref:phage tail assembly chaperone n=1 Tax=Cytobacillus kochii TaxID=859143 RepID=UPI00402A67E1
MAEKSKFINLEDILTRNIEDLTALQKGEIETSKLGTIPVTAIDNNEYKQIKKDCMKMVPNGTGGMYPELDDDKMMIRVIIAGVDKDDRSNFTFANKQLLDHLQVTTADEAVTKLLSPGEVIHAATDVQDLSGFGPKAKKVKEEEVKNS